MDATLTAMPFQPWWSIFGAAICLLSGFWVYRVANARDLGRGFAIAMGLMFGIGSGLTSGIVCGPVVALPLLLAFAVHGRGPDMQALDKMAGLNGAGKP